MPSIAKSHVSKPEDRYRQATSQDERKRIQTEVVKAYRAHVASAARRYVAPEHRADAEQAGALGVLVALEKYDPSRLGAHRVGGDRGGAFWFFAATHVRNEIQKWKDVGVSWRPRSRKKVASEEHALHMVHFSMENTKDLPSDEPTVEELLIDVETEQRLVRFAASLTVDDLAVLFSQSGRCKASRRYLSLVERAKAFIKGENDASRDHTRTEGTTL